MQSGATTGRRGIGVVVLAMGILGACIVACDANPGAGPSSLDAADPVSTFDASADAARETSVDAGTREASSDAALDAPAVCAPLPSGLLPLGLWAWQSSVLTDTTERAKLFALAESQGVRTVFVQIGPSHLPATGADASPLGRFIAEAKARCLSVELLVGEPRWALADFRSVVVGLATQAQAFVRGLVGPKPTAFRVDIEPHGIAGETSEGTVWSWANDGQGGRPAQRAPMMNQLLDTFAAVRGALGGTMPIHADVAFWLDSEPTVSPLQRVVGGAATGAPRPAHEHVIDLVDEVTLMAYRSTAFGPSCSMASCSANGIYDLSLTEVTYAASRGKKVFIGVETTNQGASLSFFGTNVATMRAELVKVSTAIGGNPGFGGFVVHDARGLAELAQLP